MFSASVNITKPRAIQPAARSGRRASQRSVVVARADAGRDELSPGRIALSTALALSLSIGAGIEPSLATTSPAEQRKAAAQTKGVRSGRTAPAVKAGLPASKTTTPAQRKAVQQKPTSKAAPKAVAAKPKTTTPAAARASNKPAAARRAVKVATKTPAKAAADGPKTRSPAASKSAVKRTTKSQVVARPVKKVAAKPVQRKAAPPPPRKKKVSRVNPLTIIATGIGLGLFAYTNRREDDELGYAPAEAPVKKVKVAPAAEEEAMPEEEEPEEEEPESDAANAAQDWINKWKSKGTDFFNRE